MLPIAVIPGWNDGVCGLRNFKAVTNKKSSERKYRAVREVCKHVLEITQLIILFSEGAEFHQFGTTERIFHETTEQFLIHNDMYWIKMKSVEFAIYYCNSEQHISRI